MRRASRGACGMFRFSSRAAIGAVVGAVFVGLGVVPAQAKPPTTETTTAPLTTTTTAAATTTTVATTSSTTTPLPAAPVEPRADESDTQRPGRPKGDPPGQSKSFCDGPGALRGAPLDPE